ncbi:50S ribosomal protein L25/general stress protein Ctc [Paenibacillus senegalensis]|uniref:50S ribosomal protein L25/general stress protein Ctc n=1 Tax=Paenibacillus senegalensis TaxID=1465766 RepID=UPI000288B458|nr:50S ribosomal protein L25/general stress protein Ctc [Paenibacillus senegalensis]
MSAAIKVKDRPDLTKSQKKQMRAEGFVPASVYGKSIDNVSVSVNQKDIFQILKTNPNGVIQLTLPYENQSHPVMIQHVQRDPISGELLHVDFHKIQMDEPVRSMVPIEIVGEAAGVKEGGVLQVQAHELEVKCLPDRIPSSLQLDVTNLEIGGNLTVADISVQDGVEVLSDANEVVVTLLAPQKNEEAEDGAGEAEAPAEAAEEDAAE